MSVHLKTRSAQAAAPSGSLASQPFKVVPQRCAQWRRAAHEALARRWLIPTRYFTVVCSGVFHCFNFLFLVGNTYWYLYIHILI